VVTYAKDRQLREEVYRAYCTRAASGDYDNSPLMTKILALRDEQAKLLGFNNYAELSVAQKMAETPSEVISFLEHLANKSLPQARAEFDELQGFAKQLDGLDNLQAWDVSFYSEKLREQKFQLSQEALRPWFPKDRVLQGLFEIVERIYGITINKQTDVDVWHQDVEFFDIYKTDDAKVKQKVGSFYLDLYARESKRGGAWMNDCRDRFKLAHKEQKPVAYLTCNFNGPVGDKPALFTHDEVVTLFHEFGHGLHHLLTEIDEVQVSGINGVEWDAVELPSQFMENYCYEKQSLALIAGHYQTDEPLSEQQLDTLYQARNFQCALQMMRQLEFALFDMKLHSFAQPPAADSKAEAQTIDIAALLDEVREQVAVIKPPKWNRFENSFSHIFAGGYAAGYYSYKWAEVLSADVWQYFLEQGILERSTGEHFLKNILSQGGSKPAMQLFEQFRGRKPSVEPLLEQLGISAN
jgi:oligopeptidase A